jgi:hypothetical protein
MGFGDVPTPIGLGEVPTPIATTLICGDASSLGGPVGDSSHAPKMAATPRTAAASRNLVDIFTVASVGSG